MWYAYATLVLQVEVHSKAQLTHTKQLLSKQAAEESAASGKANNAHLLHCNE
jgi:hypothetical protein